MCSVVTLFISIFACIILILSVSAHPSRSDETYEDSRNKREHSDGITGPVHTFVKTDKNANFKWGVRHHVGRQYSGRR